MGTDESFPDRISSPRTKLVNLVQKTGVSYTCTRYTYT